MIYSFLDRTCFSITASSRSCASNFLQRTPLTRCSNSAEDAWVWKTDDGVELFFDRNETVRFRVEAETWNDLAPENRPGETHDTEEFSKSPYTITASMQQSGLGPLLWWEDGDGEEEEG